MTKKIKIDQKNKEGLNLLILAIDCEFSIEVLDLILKKGWDIDSTDN